MTSGGKRREEWANAWLERAVARFDSLAGEVSLLPLDVDVLGAMRAEPALSGCRTPDAIHLSTALLLRDHVPAPGLVVCSFDGRMREVAAALRFRIAP